MRQITFLNDRSDRRNWHWSVIGLGMIVLAASTGPASAQQNFKSPEEATQALVAAAKADDLKKVIAILGAAGRDIVASGDKVADKNARAKFLAYYDAGHRITQDGENKAVLVIGQEEWPFPIPLVRAAGNWHFDAAAGGEEILVRRIGRNERNAVQVSLAYVDAQNEYARMDPQKNGAPVYAQRIISRPGKKDGLYWPTKEGQAASPLGELAAAAAREGYKSGKGKKPYYGYYYKILKGQRSVERGGSYDYVVHGKMIGGFALVAYPAQYRNSGVMTFIVNHEGAVYQKDLGSHTAQVASRMSSFNPDSTWQKVSPE